MSEPEDRRLGVGTPKGDTALAERPDFKDQVRSVVAGPFEGPRQCDRAMNQDQAHSKEDSPQNSKPSMERAATASDSNVIIVNEVVVVPLEEGTLTPTPTDMEFRSPTPEESGRNYQQREERVDDDACQSNCQIKKHKVHLASTILLAILLIVVVVTLIITQDGDVGDDASTNTKNPSSDITLGGDGGDDTTTNTKNPSADVACPWAGEPTFSLSNFTAKYYDNLVLVHEETVTRPSINYAWSDFHDIVSEDFSAIWTGTLTVASDSMIQVDFAYGWATASLLVNGLLVSHNEVNFFEAGSHLIEVQYFNHWHTVDFNADFHQICYKTAAEAGALVSDKLESQANIVHIDIYESSDTYLETTVLVDFQPPSSLLLILTSYSSVNWVVENPNEVEIVGVVYGSCEPATTVTVNGGGTTDKIAVKESGFDYEPSSALVQEVAGGRAPDQTYSEYGLANLSVTES